MKQLTINLQNIQATHADKYQKNKQHGWKMGQKNYTDISPKITYRWLTNTWKDQHHSLSEKCKTTVRYHLVPVRTAAIKKSTNHKCLRGFEKRKPSYTVGGNAN